MNVNLSKFPKSKHKKEKGRKFRSALAIFLPIQLFSIYILKDNPYWVEATYSSGFYQTYSGFMQRVFGWVPFSFGDLFYVLLIVVMIRYILGIFKRKFKLKKLDFFKVISFSSLIYFWFHISWGLNYYRLPLHQTLDVKKDYSTIELMDFTKYLINKTNAIHSSIAKNDTLAVVFNKTPNKYEAEVFENFKIVGFQGQVVPHQSIKPSLLSLPLSYMGFGGYLNPFSLEAQFNDKVPNYKYPSLIAHEMAHQLGYAKENEANFVSCYVNMYSKNQKIKYAGFTYALKFCLNDVYRRSPEDFDRLKSKVNPGILKNYKEVQVFWEKYNNPLEPVFKEFYGGFLKVNNQPQGIQSYNYVVALLVNYYSEKSLP